MFSMTVGPGEDLVISFRHPYFLTTPSLTIPEAKLADNIAQALAKTRAEAVKEILESKELNNVIHYTNHSNFCNWDGRNCECGFEDARWAWLHYKNDLKDRDEQSLQGEGGK